MLNESATEYYASMFDGKYPIAYTMFVPIYAHLSDVCGFEKLMTLYFSNNHEKFIQTITDSYHLKDDYLATKLFMQMEQSYNLQSGQQNLVGLREAYKTLLQMNIEKVCYEFGNELTTQDLLEKIDCSKIIGLNNVGNSRAREFLKYVQNSMEDYLKDYSNKPVENDFNKIAKTVDEFVFHRLNVTKNIDYNTYKEFFRENLCDVLLYLDQNQLYNFENYFVNNDLAINEVLNFIHDENGHINLSHLSKEDKHNAVNMIANNCKHNITNIKNQLYISDVMNEMEIEDDMNLKL